MKKVVENNAFKSCNDSDLSSSDSSGNESDTGLTIELNEEKPTKNKKKDATYKEITNFIEKIFSEENFVFHEPNDFQLRNTNIKYKRIKIETKLPNGKLSPLVVETPFLFSFGVSKRKNQETGQLNGYSIPVCLWKNDEKPNQEEKNFCDVLKKKS